MDRDKLKRLTKSPKLTRLQTELADLRIYGKQKAKEAGITEEQVTDTVVEYRKDKQRSDNERE